MYMDQDIDKEKTRSLKREEIFGNNKGVSVYPVMQMCSEGGEERGDFYRRALLSVQCKSWGGMPRVISYQGDASQADIRPKRD